MSFLRTYANILPNKWQRNYLSKLLNLLGIVGEKQKEDAMKKTISLVVCALFMVVLMSGVVLSAGEQAVNPCAVNPCAAESAAMITGKITGNQLVGDKHAYDIAETEKGKELLTHADQKVQVTGTVMESEGKKVITILHYEIIKE